MSAIEAPASVGPRERPVFSRADIAVFALTTAFLFVSFEEHFDMFSTIGFSLAYLEGHVLDFYDVNQAAIGPAIVTYLPSTYILFAVWALPLKAAGILTAPPEFPGGLSFLWFKLLTSAAYVAAGWVVYRIGLTVGLKRRGAVLLAGAWLTTPLAVFSQFIFGQYDVFTVLLMLLGFHSYLEGRMRRFAWMMAVAVTFKYFPLFIVFPLVLLAEKRLRGIVTITAIVLLPAAVEVAVYAGSPAFRADVLGYEAAGRVSSAVFAVEPGGRAFSIVFFLWFLLCGWAYSRPVPTQAERQRLAIAMSAVVFSVLFVLLPWHPQWLIVATPFLVIGGILRADRRFRLALDVILMLGFVVLIVRLWPHNVDQHMWLGGVFGRLNPALADPERVYMMKDMLPFRLGGTSLWLALFNAGLLWAALPPLRERDWDLAVDADVSIVQVLRWRFITGVLLFVGPASAAYLATLMRT